MAETAGEVVHREPVWRERANFVIAAPVSVGDAVTTEQLWVRQLAEREFEVCCIPFFVYDLALGDVVETDSEYTVRRLIHPSGRHVFRVWFGATPHPREEIVGEIHRLGALSEWSSPNLLAVDAADEDRARNVADFLAEREQRHELIYETGRR